MRDAMLSRRDFRAMPLYVKFVVVMMLLYALLMTALTGLFALEGATTAVITLVAGAFVWVLVLWVVPSRLGAD